MRAELKKIKKIPELTAKFWRDLGDKKIKRWIWEDAEEGEFQNNTGGYNYTQPYKNYKARDMKRKSDGKRLKAYSELTIESNKTSKVNMILTGHTRRGLEVKRADKTGVDLSYKPADTKKIIGNRERGYDVVGLSNENIERAKREILQQFDKNIATIKNININVKI